MPENTPEFEGEDLEEALSRAAAALETNAQDLDYEVVQEGRRGFLGVGGRGVRIRVRLPETGDPEAENGEGDLMERGPAEKVESHASPLLSPTARQVLEYLEGFVSTSPFDIEFQITEEEDRIQIDVDGPDREFLLERKGESLQALQILLGRFAAHRGSEKTVFVDCLDFRRDREEELVEIARRVSEKVKKLGEPQSLSPMNPYERRLVHLALKDDSAVVTRSEGDGFIKRVTIHPREP